MPPPSTIVQSISTPLTDAQRYLGILAIILVLEGVRRALTPVLAGLVMAVILYMFTAHMLRRGFGITAP